MFACFSCSFDTDVAADFIKHLNEKHKDQVENEDSSSGHSTETLSDRIYKCPHCMFLDQELVKVQNHIAEKHEKSVGKYSDNLVVNSLELVDDTTGAPPDLQSLQFKSQGLKGRKKLQLHRTISLQSVFGGPKTWSSLELKQEQPKSQSGLDRVNPIIQIRVETEGQREECETIFIESRSKLASASANHPNSRENRLARLKRIRRRPVRLIDLDPDEEVEQEKVGIIDEGVSSVRNVKKRSTTMARRRRSTITYPCKQCFKIFQNKCDLERHVSNIHLKLKPFACDRCDRSFGLRGNLKKHIDIVHLNKKRVNAKVTCPVCSNIYSSSHSLTLHIASVHSQEKRFQCEKCGMKFGWSGCYERHIKSVHLQEKNYKCEVCGTAFARREHLRVHSKRHAPKDDPLVKTE